MGEVVNVKAYLDINNEGFSNERSRIGKFIVEDDYFEGVIGKDFIFGNIIGKALIVHTLSNDFRPVIYNTVIKDDGGYEGSINHMDRNGNTFSCGGVRIEKTLLKSLSAREKREVREMIESAKESMDSDCRRYYNDYNETLPVALPMEESPKKRVLASA